MLNSKKILFKDLKRLLELLFAELAVNLSRKLEETVD